MHLRTTLAPHLFIYMLPTLYPLENASLPYPRMEWASILPRWLVSKAYHLFGADNVWREMLGLS
jgi:hypothetical protein